ncbi:peptidoglycan DD-metalloendopeptidase family protein [Sporolactobacillus shoreicorticis]|uniref:Murein hydrolase activator EnvC family protein n=1 Tax=Sporolactobacillus shoreicorticis TaxID=1923877 RepID=A0ABW5SA39_9BACL|nr:M23 family metallopeptidase [Sporolactobacillus shoreicorticis]MCO7126562.1 peptidoglycan DD-metalloendopeptidase family protein [Sporolactobacillus shoreicorticis]
MFKPTRIKIITTICLSCSLILGINSATVFANTQTKLDDKLNDIQNQKKENKGKLAVSKKNLSENQKKQDTVIKNIKASDKKITSMNGKIDQTKEKVRQNQASVVQLKKEIKKINARIDTRSQLLKGRLRSIYINGGAVSYLDVLMGSKSFGNFLDRLLVVKMITDQDNKIINDQKQDKQAQVTKRKKLQTVLVQTTNDLHNLQTMKTGLDQENKHKQNLLEELKDQASDIEKTVISSNEQTDILNAQESVVKQQLADLAAQQAQEKERAAAEAKAKQEAQAKKTAGTAKQETSKEETSSAKSVTVSNSTQTAAETVTSSDDSKENSSDQFMMPAAGYISSGFGYRSFDGEFHPGIDIANSTGTPIHAAADGTVFQAYTSSSYGNCVMISHVINGQLYTTVYAHMSAIYVSDGQSVSQGQTIGTMGNTGESFGTHLHFELYNGRWTPPPHNGAVNPLNFIH